MMTDHTTHFDDCGCLRAKLKAERDALRLRVAALEAAIAKARIQLDCPPQDMLDAAAALLNAHKMLAGDTTALRAMLVEAAKAGADNAYEDASSYASETEAGRLLWADGVADRILGASKGGK